LKSLQKDEPSTSSHGERILKKNTLKSLSTTSLTCGSNFKITGNFRDPMEIIKRSCDFDSIIVVLQQLKCDEGTVQPEFEVTESEHLRASQNEAELNEIREKVRESLNDFMKSSFQQECCDMLNEIGPPWNWLHNFTSHNCRYKSYNFLEKITTDYNNVEDNDDVEDNSTESFDYVKPRRVQSATSTLQSSTSGISIALHSDGGNISPSNEHKVLVDTICNISEAVERGECNIRETSSIASSLATQCERKQLEVDDYERLKMFIDKASAKGLIFNDLNALYNFFIAVSYSYFKYVSS
jgi:hypothetical protein